VEEWNDGKGKDRDDGKMEWWKFGLRIKSGGNHLRIKYKSKIC